MRAGRLVLGVLAGLALAATARPARADWTVAAFLGAGATRPGSLRIEQPATGTALTLGPVEFRGESFTAPIYYGYRIGRRLPFARWVAAEAEFIHLKVFTDPDARVRATGVERGAPVSRTQRLRDTVERFSISHGENFVLANLVARRPLGASARGVRVGVALRAGVGLTVPHPESTVAGESVDQYELGSFAWQLAGGVEVRVTRGLHGLVEYKFTRVRESVTIARGVARTTLTTHHVAIGLGYSF